MCLGVVLRRFRGAILGGGAGLRGRSFAGLDGEIARVAYKGRDAGGRVLVCCSVLLACAVVVLLALCRVRRASMRHKHCTRTCFFTVPKKPPSRAAQGLLDMAL